MEDSVVDTRCEAAEIPTGAGAETSVSEPEIQKKCSNCLNKIFACPKCGVKLEHIKGCNDFACCLYGYDKCVKTPNCNHGRTDKIPCCGHRWKISNTLMNKEPESRLRSARALLPRARAASRSPSRTSSRRPVSPRSSPVRHTTRLRRGPLKV